MKNMVRFWKDAKMPIQERQSGFTLIEAMIAVFMLAFGLVAVAQLLAAAAGSNSTAGRTTAAATQASEQMERLTAVPYPQLVDGGGLDGAAGACGGYRTERNIPGVGHVWTCWQITTGGPAGDLRLITVRSEAIGPFARLTRAELTTLRAANVSVAVAAGP